MFTSVVMYKKYKWLTYTSPDLYRLGVHISPLTRCQICFTLGLFVNYFSLKSLSLSLKSHMNVYDFNYKFIYGSFANVQCGLQVVCRTCTNSVPSSVSQNYAAHYICALHTFTNLSLLIWTRVR